MKQAGHCVRHNEVAGKLVLWEPTEVMKEQRREDDRKEDASITDLKALMEEREDWWQYAENARSLMGGLDR